MPNDSKLGRDLAERLTQKYTGRVGGVTFTYDPYVELDQLDTANPVCYISPLNYEDIREARAMWREQMQLVLSLISKVGPTDDEIWVDEWLDSWDLMIKEAREIYVLGRHKPLSVDRGERYDADVFHNHQRLFTQATFTFGNVEVP